MGKAGIPRIRASDWLERRDFLIIQHWIIQPATCPCIFETCKLEGEMVTGLLRFIFGLLSHILWWNRN